MFHFFQFRINFIHVNLRMNEHSICIDRLVVVENILKSNSQARIYCGNFQNYEVQLDAYNATLTLAIASLAAHTPQKLSLQAYFKGLSEWFLLVVTKEYDTVKCSMWQTDCKEYKKMVLDVNTDKCKVNRFEISKKSWT